MTTSLELSKALKEEGFSQKCHQFWYRMSDDSVGTFTDLEADAKFEGGEVLECAAPCAEEILEKLPHIVKNTGLLVTRSQNGKEWEVAYLGSKPFRDTSLANAAAYCWLYLKEHNLL